MCSVHFLFLPDSSLWLEIVNDFKKFLEERGYYISEKLNVPELSDGRDHFWLAMGCWEESR